MLYLDSHRDVPQCDLLETVRDYAPRPVPLTHHLYFNLNFNILLFLHPLPAPPLSRSSANEIRAQAWRPGFQGDT